MGSGGKGGGGGGGSINSGMNSYLQQLAQEAGDYWYQTEPMRQMFYGQLRGIMTGAGSGGAYGQGQSLPSGGFSPYYTGRGSTGTSTSPTQSTVQTPNLQQVPDLGEIQNSLRFYSGYPNYSGPTTYDLPYLNRIGYNQSVTANRTIPQMVDQYGVETPEYRQWLNSTANELRTNVLQQNQDALSKAMQNQSMNADGGGGGGGGVSSSDFQNAYRYNPYDLPAFQPLYNLSRYGLEDQYAKAKENIIANTPQGGPLNQALAGLESGRAYQVGALPAQIAAPIISDLVNKAYGYAFGAPQVALGGLSSAAGITSSNQMANAQLSQQGALASQAMANQQMGGLGAGIGSILGSVAFK